mmetsp:Transcript_24026/g.61162  ORF Transcript_24026/g.61162 Transcript_24026/m.61162 type:complete len:210 (+) Transcript_24026:1124-1753(+)
MSGRKVTGGIMPKSWTKKASAASVSAELTAFRTVSARVGCTAQESVLPHLPTSGRTVSFTTDVLHRRDTRISHDSRKCNATSRGLCSSSAKSMCQVSKIRHEATLRSATSCVATPREVACEGPSLDSSRARNGPALAASADMAAWGGAVLAVETLSARDIVSTGRGSMGRPEAPTRISRCASVMHSLQMWLNQLLSWLWETTKGSRCFV